MDDPSFPFFVPSLSLLSYSACYEAAPLNPARESGERCKPHLRALVEPGRQTLFMQFESKNRFRFNQSVNLLFYGSSKAGLHSQTDN